MTETGPGFGGQATGLSRRLKNSSFPSFASVEFGSLQMKRRTFKRLRVESGSTNHHSIYVVLLASEACAIRALLASNPNRDPKKPCVYVGMSGLDPEERFENHKQGIKAAAIVRRFGIRLLPELYSHLNPMPYDAAVQMEKDLADDLRTEGYTVAGGH